MGNTTTARGKRVSENADSVEGKRGIDILHDPVLNKATAYTEAERQALGLVGLVPDATESEDLQLRRVLHPLAHRGHLPAAVLADVEDAVAAHARLPVAGPLHFQGALLQGDLAAEEAHRLDLDLDARLRVFLEELGVLLLDGLAAADRLAVAADVLAVLRPEGGHRPGVAFFEGLDERLGVFGEPASRRRRTACAWLQARRTDERPAMIAAATRA